MGKKRSPATRGDSRRTRPLSRVDAPAVSVVRRTSGVRDREHGTRTVPPAFPDTRDTVDDAFASDGTVGDRWTATGTHRGDLFGVEPTGEVSLARGIAVFGVVDGGISESRAGHPPDGAGTGRASTVGVRRRMRPPSRARTGRTGRVAAWTAPSWGVLTAAR
jgi:hypothetical protein